MKVNRIVEDQPELKLLVGGGDLCDHGIGYIAHLPGPTSTIQPGEMTIYPYPCTRDSPKGVISFSNVGVVDVPDIIVQVKGHQEVSVAHWHITRHCDSLLWPGGSGGRLESGHCWVDPE